MCVHARDDTLRKDVGRLCLIWTHNAHLRTETHRKERSEHNFRIGTSPRCFGHAEAARKSHPCHCRYRDRNRASTSPQALAMSYSVIQTPDGVTCDECWWV